MNLKRFENIDSMPTSAVGVASLNLLYEVVYWNPNMQLITGVKEHEIRGKRLGEIFPGFNTPIMQRRLQNSLQNGVVEFISSVFSAGLFERPVVEGFSLKTFMLTLAPLRAEGEEAIGLILILEASNEDTEQKTDSARIVFSPADKLDIAMLVEDLIHHHHEPAILSSILGLLTTATGDLFPVLVDLLKKPNEDLRIYVLQILGDRGDRNAIPVLLEALEDPSPNIKYHAIEALGKLKAVESVGQLVSMAFSDDFFLSSSALMGLAAIGDAMVYPTLRVLWKNELLTEAMISLASTCVTIDAVNDLCQVINGNPTYSAEAVLGLAGILSRLKGISTGIHPIEALIPQLIDAMGIQNMINLAEQIPENKLPDVLQLLNLLDDPSIDKFLIKVIGNPKVKDVVIEGLVRKGSRLMPTLMHLIETGDESERAAAIISLGRIGTSEAVPILVKALDDEPQLQVLAAGALAKIGDMSAFEHLIRYLGHPDSLVRRAIISALNSIGHPRMAEAITELIDDPDPLVRESAIKIAGYFGYPSCASKVISALNDTENNVMAAAVEALPFFELDNSGNLLINVFQSANPRIRAQIAKSAAFLEKEMAIQVIELAVRDTDHWVRTYAMRTIASLGFKEFAPEVEKIIHSENPPFLLAAAMEAAGNLQIKDLLPSLQKLACSSNPDIASSAIHAIASFGTREALPFLFELIAEADTSLKKYLIPALKHFDHAEVVDFLVFNASITHDEIIRQECINTLAELETPHAYLGLLKLIKIPACYERAISTLKTRKKHYQELLWQFGQISVENRLLLVGFLQQMPLPQFRDIILRYASDDDFRVKNHYQMLLAELDLITALKDDSEPFKKN